MNERQIDLKFREFVEILNDLNEMLLGDNFLTQNHREWNDANNLTKPIKHHIRELMMWAVLGRDHFCFHKVQKADVV
jgi:inhibitor of KinA sporulation pathway (predicted exonuclease)